MGLHQGIEDGSHEVLRPRTQQGRVVPESLCFGAPRWKPMVVSVHLQALDVEGVCFGDGFFDFTSAWMEDWDVDGVPFFRFYDALVEQSCTI